MTREEIVKALRCCNSEDGCRGCPLEMADLPQGTCVDKVLFAAADMLEQDAQGWISVKDRMPETSGYYLVCTLTAFYHTQCISKVYFSGSIWGSIRKRYTNVTHWAPLPEPPKEETE